MAGLQETIAALASGRGPGLGLRVPKLSDHLTVLDFAPNPGALKAWTFVPAHLRRGAPLVVLLHGCLQDAAGYDALTGWSQLATAHGFALLLPEQNQGNNPNACFNWFVPEDVAREGGEARSIRAMITVLVDRHGLDRSRVFVSGFSAGGAMACVILAAYPEVFAAGAVIAGLPYGCATTMAVALAAMRMPPQRPARAWGDLVREAAPRPTRWPAVAVWQGTADRVVAPANADALVSQWLDVHGLAEDAGTAVDESLCRRMLWRDTDGRVAVERVIVPGIGHAIPVADAQPGRRASTYAAPIGLPASLRIAQSWGLVPTETAQTATRPAGPTRRTLPLIGPILDRLAGRPKPAADPDESWQGDWTVESAQRPHGVRLTGRATSRLGVDAALARCRVSRHVELGTSRTLVYERKLDLRAAINVMTSASFVVSFDGVVVDQEEVVFGVRHDDDWVVRRIDLGAVAGRVGMLTFEVAALSNVFIEASAAASVRNITLATQVPASVAERV